MRYSTLKNVFIECVNKLYNRSIVRGAAKAFAMRNKLNKYSRPFRIIIRY